MTPNQIQHDFRDDQLAQDCLRGHYHSHNDDGAYLVNHSLGERPRVLRHSSVAGERWEIDKVGGHFEGNDEDHWYTMDETVRERIAKLFGAGQLAEVAVPGGDLSSNLERLLGVFYAPTANSSRTALVGLKNDFYSDTHILAGTLERENDIRRRMDQKQIKSEDLMAVDVREDGQTITTEDIIAKIEAVNERLAILLIPHIHFITGIKYDLNRITRAVHTAGGIIIVDAAHALGNVQMHYSHDKVDAAAACTYKYFSAGPGNDAAVFVNQAHFGTLYGPRVVKGWFSHDSRDRFKRKDEGEQNLADGASVLRRGNANIASMTLIKDAAQVFNKVGGMRNVEKWNNTMFNYCYNELRNLIDEGRLKLLTPTIEGQHGAMLSFVVDSAYKKALEEALEDAGIKVDWRDPNIMRVSFHSLHNTFSQITFFTETVKNVFAEKSK